ncbi:type 1 glutamine amidotransferase [Shimia sp.]|uniref:type 1 glutamine amidotransferase n=1 Tax=Shimia sp. TaxID=1954381 RepID=UPI00356B103D
MTRILILEGNSVQIVQRGQSSAAGFIATLMAINPGLRLVVQNPYAAPVAAADLQGIDAVVFTGSAVAWNTSDPRGQAQADAMRRVFDAGLPVWGSCNGLQLLATVLGGAVAASPKGREDGLAVDIRLSDAGRSHPMMAGRADGYAVPCIHRDEISALPEGTLLLAGNEHSPVQAVAHERDGIDFWGTQYHPELAPGDIAAALERMEGVAGADRIADLRACAGDAAAARRLGARVEDMQPERRSLELRNWLAHLGARP